MSLFTRVSNEELEGAEGSIETPEVDPIELLDAQETLPDDMVELQQDIVALEEAEEVQEQLETTLTELEANPEPTEEAVVVANEQYKMACYKLGLKPSVSYSGEDIAGSYKLTTEGIKDVIVKVVEAIKDMLAKIALFIKKMYVKFLVLVNNDAKELETLVPQIIALEQQSDGKLFLENMKDHTALKMFSDSISQRLSALTELMGYNNSLSDDIKDYYERITKNSNIIKLINHKNENKWAFQFENLRWRGSNKIDSAIKVKLGSGINVDTVIINTQGRYVNAFNVIYKDKIHTNKLQDVSDFRYDKIKVFDTFDHETTKRWMSALQTFDAQGFKTLAGIAKVSAAGIQNMMKEYDKLAAEVKAGVESATKIDEIKENAAERASELRLVNKVMRINSEILLDNIKSIMYNNRTTIIMGRYAIKYNKQNKMYAEFEGTTTKEEIKRRYKELSKKYHPDAGGDAESFNTLKNHYDGLMAGAAA